MPINIDEHLHNADWTKHGRLDIPYSPNHPKFKGWLAKQGLTTEEFERLPVYKAWEARREQRKVKKSLETELEKGFRPMEELYPNGRWVTIRGHRVYIKPDGQCAEETMPPFLRELVAQKRATAQAEPPKPEPKKVELPSKKSPVLVEAEKFVAERRARGDTEAKLMQRSAKVDLTVGERRTITDGKLKGTRATVRAITVHFEGIRYGGKHYPNVLVWFEYEDEHDERKWDCLPTSCFR